MGQVMRRRWEGDPSVGQTRRDRQGCEYNAYVPDPLVGQRFVLDGDVAADVADAEAALHRLDAAAAALTNSEAIARLLLRAESVASSRIEGLEIGARRLLRAQVAHDLGESPTDVTAEEVLANIEAMSTAVSLVDAGTQIGVGDILDVHARLLRGTRLEEHGGRLRTVQNWIGGSGFNPCAAAFVPPPPELVAELFDDLCAFCNTDALPAVAQAAVAHAQFETIHPFVDGNGRTGRALIHMVLRRRGLTSRVLPPVSLVLATWADDYVAALTATRHLSEPGSPDGVAANNGWIARFSAACTRAVADAERFEATVRGIQESWRSALAPVRADSSADLLIGALPGAPVVTVDSAAALIGRSFQSTNEAVARLVGAGVLRPVTVARRKRAFEAPRVIDAFSDLERRLASPVGDTCVEGPARVVPARRQRS